jgi:hypothetical protein
MLSGVCLFVVSLAALVVARNLFDKAYALCQG